MVTVIGLPDVRVIGTPVTARVYSLFEQLSGSGNGISIEVNTRNPGLIGTNFDFL